MRQVGRFGERRWPAPAAEIRAPRGRNRKPFTLLGIWLYMDRNQGHYYDVSATNRWQILPASCRRSVEPLLSCSGKETVTGRWGDLRQLAGRTVQVAAEDWLRLADYVVAGRVELGMRDRRAFAQATGVTERTIGKLENGQQVSPTTLAMVEIRLGWAPGSCRQILAGGEPTVGSPDHVRAGYEDPTLLHLSSTPGLPPDVVRGLVALARNWRQGDDGTDEQAQRRT